MDPKCLTPALEQKILRWKGEEAGDEWDRESLNCHVKEKKELNPHLTPHQEFCI